MEEFVVQSSDTDSDSASPEAGHQQLLLELPNASQEGRQRHKAMSSKSKKENKKPAKDLDWSRASELRIGRIGMIKALIALCARKEGEQYIRSLAEKGHRLGAASTRSAWRGQAHTTRRDSLLAVEQTPGIRGSTLSSDTEPSESEAAELAEL